jgi:SPP1 family predicted phage head-tail adaptor
MRSGSMDRTIRIDAYIPDAVNDYGTVAPSWSAMATVRAQVIEANTEEFIRAFGASDETVIVFRTRFLADVTTSHRVHYRGANYDIKQVKEIGRRKGLELRAVATSEAA